MLPNKKKPAETKVSPEEIYKYEEEIPSEVLEAIIKAEASDENKYKYLYFTAPDMQGGYKNHLHMINGASTIENADLGFNVVEQDHRADGKPASFNIFIENNTLKLCEILYNSPYGIIKKNRTGIGATTLELRSPRNSIIVVPTKALAAGKAIASKDENGKYHVLYVGSPIDSIPDAPSIFDYLRDRDVEHKKIMVVADSLPKVIKAIGKSVYEDYFIMIDEIDTYQSDSTYRPKLEDVIDYYFKFEPHLRCMVSATVQEFSNPEINKEPVIEIEYLEEERRKIELIHTDNPNAIAKEEIERLFDSDPDQKIVIAYNKIQYIRQIIQNLKIECQEECSILCAEQSMHRAGDYYTEINDGHLQKRITFMTCSFFAGIDILDRFHLISISNAGFIYTLLSTEKYKQIAGRCRDKEGLLSETIIYHIPIYTIFTIGPTIDEQKQNLIKFANDMAGFINGAQKLEEEYPTLLSQKRFSGIKQEILKRTKKSYHGSSDVNLVRQNVNTGMFQPAYFVIDSVCESLRLKDELYARPEILPSALDKENIISHRVENRKYTDEQRKNDGLVNKKLKDIEKESAQDLFDILINLYGEDNLNESSLKSQQIKTKNKDSQKWLGRFMRLSKFIPSDRLFGDWDKITADETTFRGYNNAAIFWALEDGHPVKSDLMGKFTIGIEYTSEEIKSKMINFYSHNFHKECGAKTKHAQLLGEYVQTERVNPHTNSYRVVDYDKHHIPGQLLSRIPEGDDSWIALLEFSSGVKDI